MKALTPLIRLLVVFVVVLLGIAPAGAANQFDLTGTMALEPVNNVSSTYAGPFGNGEVYVTAASKSGDSGLLLTALYVNSNGSIASRFVQSFSGAVSATDVAYLGDNIIVVAMNTTADNRLKLISYRTNGPSNDRFQRIETRVLDNQEITGEVRIIRVGPTNRLLTLVHLPDGRVRFDAWRLESNGTGFSLKSTHISVGVSGKVEMTADRSRVSNAVLVSAQDDQDRMVMTLMTVEQDFTLKKQAEILRGEIKNSDITLSNNRIYTVTTNKSSWFSTATVTRWEILNISSGVNLPKTLQYKNGIDVPLNISGKAQIIDQDNNVVVVAQSGSKTDSNDWHTMRFVEFHHNGGTDGFVQVGPIKTLPNKADDFDLASNGESNFLLFMDSFANGQARQDIWRHN